MTPQSSGYDLLVQAGQTILPGPNGSPSISEQLSPEENLKNQRLAVERNAPALALVRLALQKPVEILEVMPGEKEFAFYANMREVARQFIQESDVRFADGDYETAMSSRLDAMEMGTTIGRGFIIPMLVNMAIELITSRAIDNIAAKLDAPQCREAIARLEKIEERRTTLVEALECEQKHSLSKKLATLGDPKALAELKSTEDGGFYSAQDIDQFKALTPEELTENNERLFGAAIEAAKLPFFQSAKFHFPQDIEPFTKSALMYLDKAHYRFSYDLGVARNRLLRAALQLRVQKLETGGYPENFIAPIDPFAAGDKPLIYRKTDASYLLYSVGFNGIDENGTEIQTIEASATGDIVQRPL
ncbi:hypothetical protein EON83_08865 [bacterium]|nr:MAG: hypothetical protein EON83_08865 [bacterium]